MTINESPTPPTTRWIAVALVNALESDEEMLAIENGQTRIALFRVNSKLYATENICTHANAALTDGWLEGCIVECPLHGGRFDVTTGKGLGPPITCDLKTYDVRIVGNDIEIAIEQEEGQAG